MKCLGINLTEEVKDLYNQNGRTLKREIKEDLGRWKELLNMVIKCSRGRAHGSVAAALGHKLPKEKAY